MAKDFQWMEDSYRNANWLPTAPGKPFSLTWRTYIPKEIVKQGNWFPPTLAKRG